MRVVPQHDGSLHISAVSPEVVYDFGNTRLYACVDSAGNVRTLRVSEGASLIREWHHILRVDDTTCLFDSADACGRTFTLHARAADVQIALTTFVNDKSPALFQLWQFHNTAPHTRALTLALDVALGVNETLPDYFTALGITVPARVSAHLSATLAPLHITTRADDLHYAYRLELAPRDSADLCIVFSVGDVKSHRAYLDNWRAHYASARAYNAWLTTRWHSSDALLQSLFVAALNAAIAAYKELPSGLAGFFAGPAYAVPPRFYFRDAYWTIQALLPFHPDWVRQQLFTLARGIQDNGACPSGVFDAGLFDAPTRERLAWLADHYDSPSFFVLMLADYLHWTNDYAILNHALEGMPTLWTQARACLEYLHTRDRDGDGLFEKPYAPNDWADNVYRSALVTYDLALYFRALVCAAEIARARGEASFAHVFTERAERVKHGINQKLWDDARGYYVDYCRDNFVEHHLTTDSLLTLLYGIADETRARRVLNAAQWMLQSRYNHEQPYGDWGVLCAFPPYQRAEDLFGLSAEPYRYHNGADWLYWDAVYAQILLARGDDAWRYVLTRGWEYGLTRGWLTPVEYFSPPYPPGGFLQAWSSLPAAVLYQYKNWL
jgi:glycogen debranching enzyme